jgi:hypothetical protein
VVVQALRPEPVSDLHARQDVLFIGIFEDGVELPKGFFGIPASFPPPASESPPAAFGRAVERFEHLGI